MAVLDGAGVGRVVLGVGAATLFGVYADLAFNIMSATNSSPQTTELFAKDRSDTLWKWVKVGDAAILGFGAFGAGLLVMSGQRKLAIWPLVGSGAVAVAMHGMYSHAVSAGKRAR